MIEGLTIVTTELNISLSVILCFIAFAISLPFGAKSFDLFLIAWTVLNALLVPAFKYWDTSLDWTLPFKLFILSVVIMALTLRDRTNNGGLPL